MMMSTMTVITASEYWWAPDSLYWNRGEGRGGRSDEEDDEVELLHRADEDEDEAAHEALAREGQDDPAEAPAEGGALHHRGLLELGPDLEHGVAPRGPRRAGTSPR